ncbi:hypothetical protein D6D03_07207 [Aureobasidium pullulans]|nr:hypothetical protein D6D03_07207 [Aureobasidium pullulans]
MSRSKSRQVKGKGKAPRKRKGELWKKVKGMSKPEDRRPRTANDTSDRSCSEQRLMLRRSPSSGEKKATTARIDARASNQVHTALDKFDRNSFSVIDFLRDRAQLSQITDPRTGDMSPLETDSREKTKGRSLLASATSAVDDLSFRHCSEVILTDEMTPTTHDFHPQLETTSHS